VTEGTALRVLEGYVFSLYLRGAEDASMQVIAPTLEAAISIATRAYPGCVVHSGFCENRYNERPKPTKLYFEEPFSEDQVERLTVQLAGCSTAAMGATKEPAERGDYGWSQAYQDVLELRRKYDQLFARRNPSSARKARKPK